MYLLCMIYSAVSFDMCFGIGLRTIFEEENKNASLLWDDVAVSYPPDAYYS